MNYEKISHILNFTENINLNSSIDPYAHDNDTSQVTDSFLYCFFDLLNTSYEKNYFIFNFKNFKKSFFNYLKQNNNYENLNSLLNKEIINNKSILLLITKIYKINIKIFDEKLNIIENYQNKRYTNINLLLIKHKECFKQYKI